MATRRINPIPYERFGTYNNLRSNPYSDSERILDVRNGVLDPYTQIAQSAMQNSYTVDSLSAFGNTFRARVLGVVKGKPARHLYPDLYVNSRVTPDQIPEYFIFSLRDETDQFAPDPLRYASTVQSYVNMIGLQGRAISEKPANETVEAYGRGDIVEVYKPEQNSWNGAVVRKVVARNNFSNFITGSAGAGVAELFGGSAGQPFNNGGVYTALGDNPTPRAPEGPIPGYPRLTYQFTGIRRFPVQPQLLRILQRVAEKHDLYIVIWAGGQISEAQGGSYEDRTRTDASTVRHDNGWAADIRIYPDNTLSGNVLSELTRDSGEGKIIVPRRWPSGTQVSDDEVLTADEIAEFEEQEIYQIVRSFYNAGITGIGADHDYQDGDLHVDIAFGRNPGVPDTPYWGKGPDGEHKTSYTLDFVRHAYRQRDAAS